MGEQEKRKKGSLRTSGVPHSDTFHKQAIRILLAGVFMGLVLWVLSEYIRPKSIEQMKEEARGRLTELLSRLNKASLTERAAVRKEIFNLFSQYRGKKEVEKVLLELLDKAAQKAPDALEKKYLRQIRDVCAAAAKKRLDADFLWRYGEIVEGLKSPDAERRIEAVKALAESGDREAAKLLVRCLGDGAAGVRKAAKEALISFGEKGSKLLVAALKSDSYFVRRNAAEILEKLNWQPADKQQRLAFLAAKHNWKALAQLGTDGISAILEEYDRLLTPSANPNNRNFQSDVADNIVAAIKETGTYDEALILILRKNMHTLLAKMLKAGAKLKFKHLKEIAAKKDVKKAETVLEKFGGEIETKLFARLLWEENARLRRKPQLAHLILKILRKRNWLPHNRREEAAYLALMGRWSLLLEKGEAGMEILKDALLRRDEPYMNREYAAAALTEAGKKGAEILVEVFMAGDDLGARIAENAIKRIGERAIATLKEALQNASNPTVRRRIQKLLHSLSEKTPQNPPK